MLIIDLRRCLNSSVNSITRKTVETSSTMLEVTIVSPPIALAMARVAGARPL
jgi:hypothetical protein